MRRKPRRDQRDPGAHGGECALAAQARGWRTILLAGFSHQTAEQIVSQQVHLQFLLDHRRRHGAPRGGLSVSRCCTRAQSSATEWWAMRSRFSVKRTQRDMGDLLAAQGGLRRAHYTSIYTCKQELIFARRPWQNGWATEGKNLGDGKKTSGVGSAPAAVAGQAGPHRDGEPDDGAGAALSTGDPRAAPAGKNYDCFTAAFEKNPGIDHGECGTEKTMRFQLIAPKVSAIRIYPLFTLPLFSFSAGFNRSPASNPKKLARRWSVRKVIARLPSSTRW